MIKCDCGLEQLYTETGEFDPPLPYENIAQWNSWQFEQLENRDFEHEGSELFHDDNMLLTKIGADHKQEELSSFTLTQYEDRLHCGDREFMLSDISRMGLVQTNVLLLTCKDEYYQIKANNPTSLRKYMAVWKEKRGA